MWRKIIQEWVLPQGHMYHYIGKIFKKWEHSIKWKVLLFKNFREPYRAYVILNLIVHPNHLQGLLEQIVEL